MLEELLGRDQWPTDRGQSVMLRYFAQGIPCPFLEEESCSIHADRPTACREYLVTSPAENCSRPTPETVEMVPVPLKVWTALSRFDEVPAGGRYICGVPLVLAPEWAESHPEEPPPRPGPELLQELFEKLKESARAPAPDTGNVKIV
jgi:Fe-S-cluster containining protein